MNILEAANDSGVTKTKIIYKAYLSHAQTKEYLAILIEGGLLEHDKSKGTLKTTDKAYRFLKTYDQIAEVLKLEES
jgi:predicted transcriptional regulator